MGDLSCGLKSPLVNRYLTRSFTRTRSSFPHATMLCHTKSKSKYKRRENTHGEQQKIQWIA